MGKLAIVASGGGMSCSYLAGALLALAEVHNITQPDIVIGGSGAAITLPYYLAGQYNEIKKVNINYLTSKEFINPLRLKKMVNLDYLIDIICKNFFPLNIKKLKSLKSKCLIATTNATNGKIKYFSAKNKEVLNIIKASLAIPIVYGNEIKIKKDTYIDTYTSSSTELNIRKAIELGADKIIVIESSSKSPRLNKLILKLFIKFKGKEFEMQYKKDEEKRKQFKVPNDIKVIFLKPETNFNLTILQNKKSLVWTAMDHAYMEVGENIYLKSFF